MSLLLDAPQGAEEYELFVHAGSELLVTLLDSVSGAPVAGAAAYRPAAAEPFAESDGEGRIAVLVRAGMELDVTVVAEDYCVFRWIHGVRDAAMPDVSVPMIRRAWVEGVVVDAGGEPVEGAYLESDGHELAPGRLPSGGPGSRADGPPGYTVYETARRGSGSVQSDERGEFRLPVVAAERVIHVRASHRDYVSAEVGPLELSAPGERTHARLVLHRGATVRGRVRFNGEPWQGMVIWRDGEGDLGGRAFVDQDGAYELLNVREGTVRITVEDRMARSVLSEATRTVVAGEEYEQDFAWSEELGTIAGRVVGPGGEPRAGVVVQAVHHPPGGGSLHFSERTSEDGTYAVEVPAGHEYEVSVREETLYRSRAGVPAGSQNVDFELPLLGNLRLKLIDARTGKPVHARGAARVHRLARPRVDQLQTEVAQERQLEVHVLAARRHAGPRAVERLLADRDLVLVAGRDLDGVRPVLGRALREVQGAAPGRVVHRLDHDAGPRLAARTDDAPRDRPQLLRPGEVLLVLLARDHGPRGLAQDRARHAVLDRDAHRPLADVEQLVGAVLVDERAPSEVSLSVAPDHHALPRLPVEAHAAAHGRPAVQDEARVRPLAGRGQLEGPDLRGDVVAVGGAHVDHPLGRDDGQPELAALVALHRAGAAARGLVDRVAGRPIRARPRPAGREPARRELVPVRLEVRALDRFAAGVDHDPLDPRAADHRDAHVRHGRVADAVDPAEDAVVLRDDGHVELHPGADEDGDATLAVALREGLGGRGSIRRGARHRRSAHAVEQGDEQLAARVHEELVLLRPLRRVEQEAHLLLDVARGRGTQQEGDALACKCGGDGTTVLCRTTGDPSEVCSSARFFLPF